MKYNIDILEFFQTGKFDFLQIGKSKEWILNNFSPPDDWSNVKTLKQATIWRYGNIELHFDNQELVLIFSDYIEDLDGGKSIVLNKWILDRPKSLTLSNIIKEFNNHNMDFTVIHNNLNYVELKILKSKVNLTFCIDEDERINANGFSLCAFSLSSKR